MSLRLTVKQQRWIEAYVENGGNATQAALEAYDTGYDSARVIGSENLAKPNIRWEIQARMGDARLTTEDALHTVKQALEATNVKDRPDWRSRLKAADMTLKLTGAYSRGEMKNDDEDVDTFGAALERMDQRMDLMTGYWILRYMEAHGDRLPVAEQLEEFKSALGISEVKATETRVRLAHGNGPDIEYEWTSKERPSIGSSGDTTSTTEIHSQLPQPRPEHLVTTFVHEDPEPAETDLGAQRPSWTPPAQERLLPHATVPDTGLSPVDGSVQDQKEGTT
ncbi:terminase small subunit [Acidobacteria bacterium AH-259-O06]|nr:terminase small subunit [Acidobacteria bacterium AH-259-O06]